MAPEDWNSGGDSGEAMADFIAPLSSVTQALADDFGRVGRGLDGFDRPLRLASTSLVRFGRAIAASLANLSASPPQQHPQAFGQAGPVTQTGNVLPFEVAGLAGNTAATLANTAALAATTTTLRALSLLAGAQATATTARVVQSGLAGAPVKPQAPTPQPLIQQVPAGAIRTARRTDAELRETETPEQTQRRLDRNARARAAAARKRMEPYQQAEKEIASVPLEQAEQTPAIPLQQSRETPAIPLQVIDEKKPPPEQAPALERPPAQAAEQTATPRLEQLPAPEQAPETPATSLPRLEQAPATAQPTATAQPADAGPSLAQLAFDQAEADRDRKRKADLEAKLDREGVPEQERGKRRQASERAAAPHRERRRQQWEAQQQPATPQPATQQPEPAVAQAVPQAVPQQAPPAAPPLLPLEMTPAEQRAAGVGMPRQTPASTPASPAPPAQPAPPTPTVPPATTGGKAGPAAGRAGLDWVSALRANTDATARNTQALLKAFGGPSGGTVGRAVQQPAGPPPGGGPAAGGNFGVARSDPWAGLSSGLDRLTSSATAAGAGILGLVSLASPSVFSTFTGSIKVLSAEVGTVFVPHVQQAAYWVQDWTTWFHGLSEGTRSTIGWIGSFVVKIGLAASAIRMIGAATGISAAAQWGFNAALGAFPVTAAITGLTALGFAVYEAGRAWGWWGQQAEKAAGQARRAGQVDGPGAGGPGRDLVKPIDPKKDFGFLPADVRQRLEQAKGASETRGILDQFKKSVERDKAAFLGGQAGEANRLNKPIEVMAKRIQDFMPSAHAAYERAVGDYAFRTGNDPDKFLTEGARGFRVPGVAGSAFERSPEFKQYTETLGRLSNRLEKETPESAAVRATITMPLAPWFAPEATARHAPQAPALRPLANVPGFHEKMAGFNQSLDKVDDLIKRSGGDHWDDVVGKQSQFLDYQAYFDQIQLTELNQKESELRVLEIQLEELRKSGRLLENIAEQNHKEREALVDALRLLRLQGD